MEVKLKTVPNNFVPEGACPPEPRTRPIPHRPPLNQSTAIRNQPLITNAWSFKPLDVM